MQRWEVGRGGDERPSWVGCPALVFVAEEDAEVTLDDVMLVVEIAVAEKVVASRRSEYAR
jgi:hypothetical protein